MNNGLNGMNQLNLNDNRWKSRNEINFGLYNLLRQWVINRKQIWNKHLNFKQSIFYAYRSRMQKKVQMKYSRHLKPKRFSKILMSESSEPKRSRYLIYVGLFFYIHICIFQIIYKYIFYQETHLRTNRELQIIT